MVVCAYKQQLQKLGKNDLRLLIIKSAYKISTYIFNYGTEPFVTFCSSCKIFCYVPI